MRKRWVIGNWKLNPDFTTAQHLLAQLQQYAESSIESHCQVAIAVPMPYAVWAIQHAPHILVGVQDVSTIEDYGAYTGEVNAQLLRSIQAKFVLIGHSERRQWFADDVTKLQAKIRHSLAQELTIVYCVGESLAQREAGHAETVVLQQVQDLLNVVSGDHWKHIIIAYEPIWAIGTGKTASADDAQAIHASIRAYLSQNNVDAEQVSILYGGSVKADNAQQFSQCADIDGALVGGASLDAHSFQAIIQAFEC